MMKRFTLHSLVSLMVVAMVSCGASANTSIGYSLRSAFSHLPGLAWVSPITPLGFNQSQFAAANPAASGRVATQIPWSMLGYTNW
jgi:pyruvate/2-oxoglutarate/acetoin dehydrogenase E1 component